MTTEALGAAIAQACAASAAQHDRLCPRQVLGVRMGLAVGHALDLSLPRQDKRLLLFAETDGCLLDGISAATGCTVGHRTMRIVDYGRVALTALDLERGEAFRIAPRPGVRELARDYAAPGLPRYAAQLEGYQRIPELLLFDVVRVRLALDVDALLGRPGSRVNCSQCGEEVLNQRETYVRGQAVCPGCRDSAYYEPFGSTTTT